MNSQNCSLNTSEAQSTAQYINSFLDLVENLPNEISRHLSQLHQLNNNYLKLINRTDTNVDRYKQLMTTLANNRPNSSNKNSENKETNDNLRETLNEKTLNLSKKIETQLIQIQELSDEKLRYSQMIFDLIETKAKELDFDYEEVIQFNGKISNNVSESTANRINGSTLSNKFNANSSSQNGSINGTVSQVKEEAIKKEVNEDLSNNNKIIDKRSLPRRACALKSGQPLETNEETVEINVAKVPQNKTIKSKSFSKCHNFGLSMSNFYRNMARRRAKGLPKGTKICKIGAKISDSKKSVQSVKQNDRKPKTNRNSIKRLIAAKSAVKHTNGTNSNVQKKLVRNKSSNGYTSSSSSSSSSSSMSGDETFNAPKGSDSRNVNQKREKTSNQENGRRESKRSANNYNNTNGGTNKKSKTNSNSFESTEQFVGEPIDPNEPTYCLCDQVSFGQMICCDNDRCTIEWFHFPCVGLEVKPKGKWYCPRCRKAPRLQNVPKRQTNSAKD